MRQTNKKMSMVLLTAMCLCCFTNIGQAASDRPNVILIITDDQGYGDIAAHGNPVIRTPNMDKLYHSGIRFTNFHVDPTCSPTRGALMTGKYSHRARVWHTVMGGNFLRASEVTMADVFKATGYQTGMFGKWHLGSGYPYRPLDRGFDEWLSHGDGGTGTTDDYFWNDRVNDMYYYNMKREWREGWGTDVFFEAATTYIKKRDKERPFFIYLATYLPHTPLTIPDKSWVDYYRDKDISLREAYYFATIEHVDRNIGLLRECLEKEGLAENTIVIFMTDNGGTIGTKVFNAGMKGRKGTPYDGGHRVPLFIHWPGGGLDRPADRDHLTAHIDLLPTLIDLCGLQAPKGVDFDGRSLKPLLFDAKADWPARTLCVEKQRSRVPDKGENCAVMTEKWRLVNSTELYDIEKDPGQRHDVAARHPDVVKKLLADFDTYWEHVSPGDRDLSPRIIGTRHEPESYLHSMDLRTEDNKAQSIWNHDAVAQGIKAQGFWPVIFAEGGLYQFDVCRWPREVDAVMRGVPSKEKTVDAWEYDKPITGTIYGDTFNALPVYYVRLEVGDLSELKAVSGTDKAVNFRFSLNAGENMIKTTMLDKDKKPLGSAYYCYVKKIAGD